MEKLIIAGKEFNSRLFLGTGKFGSNDIMSQAIEASETEMVTMAMKRIELGNDEDDMMQHIVKPGIQLLPNTSGTRNAEEAVFAAKMAREAFGTNWLKLEIHPDPRYLLPDPIETLKATELLVKEGFVVLPYCQADPVLCKRLAEAGAATVTEVKNGAQPFEKLKKQYTVRLDRPFVYMIREKTSGAILFIGAYVK